MNKGHCYVENSSPLLFSFSQSDLHFCALVPKGEEGVLRANGDMSPLEQLQLLPRTPG